MSTLGKSNALQLSYDRHGRASTDYPLADPAFANLIAQFPRNVANDSKRLRSPPEKASVSPMLCRRQNGRRERRLIAIPMMKRSRHRWRKSPDMTNFVLVRHDVTCQQLPPQGDRKSTRLNSSH